MYIYGFLVLFPHIVKTINWDKFSVVNKEFLEIMAHPWVGRLICVSFTVSFAQLYFCTLQQHLHIVQTDGLRQTSKSVWSLLTLLSKVGTMHKRHVDHSVLIFWLWTHQMRWNISRLCVLYYQVSNLHFKFEFSTVWRKQKWENHGSAKTEEVVIDGSEMGR